MMDVEDVFPINDRTGFLSTNIMFFNRSTAYVRMSVFGNILQSTPTWVYDSPQAETYDTFLKVATVSNMIAGVILIDPLKADTPTPNSQVCLWNTASNKPTWCYTFDMAMTFASLDIVKAYVVVGTYFQAGANAGTSFFILDTTTGKLVYSEKDPARLVGCKFLDDATLLFQTDDGATVNTNNVIMSVSDKPQKLWSGVLSGYISSNSNCKNQFILEDLYGGGVYKFSENTVTKLLSFVAEDDFLITLAYQAENCNFVYLGETTPTFKNTLLTRYDVQAGTEIKYPFANSTGDQDEVSHIDVSDKFESVCIWGDKTASFPQWYIFDVEAKMTDPTTYQFPGSAFESYFLPNGDKMYWIIISKGNHANEWGYEYLDVFEMVN